MKSSLKINSLMLLIGSIFLLAGVFAKPLGIPSALEIILPLAAIGFIWLGYRGIRQAKTEGQIPAATGSQKKKTFVIMAVCSGAAQKTPPRPSSPA